MTVMKRARVLAIVLAATMLAVLFAGCQTTDTSWVLDHEGERLPAGAYILFVNQALIEATNIVYNEWEDWEPSYENEEPPPSLLEMSTQEILNLPLHGTRLYDWVVSEAVRLSRRYLALTAKMAQLGIEPDPENLAMAMRDAAADYRLNEAMFREIGVAEFSLALNYRSSVYMEALFDALYNPGGPREVTMSELLRYFEENFVRGQEIVFFLENVSANQFESDEEYLEAQVSAQMNNAMVRALAESFLERLQDGESFEQLTYERDQMFSPNPENVEMPQEGQLAFLTRNDNMFMNQSTVEGLNSLAIGQFGIFEDEWVISLVQRLETQLDPRDLENHREEIVFGLRFEDDFLPLLDELGAQLPISVNNAAIARYSPDRLLD